jgi:protein TonB
VALRPLDVVYGISFGVHVVLIAVLNLIKEKPPEEIVAVQLSEVEKPEKEKEEEKEPEPEPIAAPPPRAPKAAPETAPPPAPDYGFKMSSSMGSGGPGGVVVPTAAPAVPVTKTLSRKISDAPEDGCSDPIVKATATTMPHPEYTEDARAASIEGKVRVELTVEPDGSVSAAKTVEGLGHGLDEAAVAALKDAKFSPATKCGKAVPSTFIVGIRFAL